MSRNPRTRAALLAFASDVVPLIKARFDESEHKDESHRWFKHDGWFYSCLSKKCWETGLTEYYVLRYDDVDEHHQRAPHSSRETAYIYREGVCRLLSGKGAGTDPGFIFDGFSIQNFKRHTL